MDQSGLMMDITQHCFTFVSGSWGEGVWVSRAAAGRGVSIRGHTFISPLCLKAFANFN